MLIKASRITNLTDARYFAAKEADFLGFNLEEGTEGYLDPVYMKAIREWVEGPKIVGEFSRADSSVIREAARFFGLDAVQVTGAYAARLAELEGLELIMQLDGAQDHASLLQTFGVTRGQVAWYLVFLKPGMPDPEETAFWKKCCADYPVLLEADVPEAQWPDFLAELRPAGLGLTGGDEEQVGVKSFDEIDLIFEALGR